ncbi:hypothetical protein QJS04_geneDACA003888 [Acorus gramineus]|uniref:Uncharacterized protein n=1 Tax=Acorus gramineus TaxID=55184 RepID=A0AAV9BJM3_ACOGR|nr:hypothetical protein QJS04_geneDACA003888 [Acorus gramineus]
MYNRKRNIILKKCEYLHSIANEKNIFELETREYKRIKINKTRSKKHKKKGGEGNTKQ